MPVWITAMSNPKTFFEKVDNWSLRNKDKLTPLIRLFDWTSKLSSPYASLQYIRYFEFPAMWLNLTLALNRSGSTQGHNLDNLGSTCIDNATYQVSRSSVNWFWRRRFFKVFTIYGHGGHLGHVTRSVWTTFRSPDPWRLHMNFCYYWPSSFRGEVVWNCWRTTDGACLYFKLPRSLRLRWANYPGWGKRAKLAAWCKMLLKKLQWAASSGHIINVKQCKSRLPTVMMALLTLYVNAKTTPR